MVIITNEDWERVIIALVSAIVGGIITQIVRVLIDNYREKRKSSYIEDNMNNKVITQTTLCKLQPGKSIDMMIQLLGHPLVYSEIDFDLFEWAEELRDRKNEKMVGKTDNLKTLKSYTYKFKNTNIKVTTHDCKTINSLTIIPHYKEKIDISELYLDKLILNKSRYNFDNSNFDFLYTSVKDFLIMIRVSLPNPLYRNFTFFFYDYYEMKKYTKTKDANDMKGATIQGICITNMGNDEIYYIFDNEVV